MRFIVCLVVACVLVVTSSVMAAEPPDSDPDVPRTFAVWERPAAGVFLAATGIGDPNSHDASPEIGFVFDTPVVFGVRLRADASRTSWLFEERDGYGDLGLRDAVGLDSVRLSLLRVRHPGSRTAVYVGGGYGGYRYSYAHAPLRGPWRGGLHGVAGLEVAGASQRHAFNVECRIHAIDGTGQPPVASVVLFKLDAAVGVKMRF